MSARIQVASTLIAGLREGQEIAFRMIYDQMHRPIYRMIHALVKDATKTEELVQETFVALWVNRQRLNADQPLYPYVYLTAKRLAIDHFRKTLLETQAVDHLKHSADLYTSNTEETIAVADLHRFAEETIRRLPLQQQTVFMLSRNEGLSYEEIAQRLQISPNTVRNHMVCALRTIKLRFLNGGLISLLVGFISLLAAVSVIR
ncbi:RNA polymerase sigma factor [Parapedobacter deserti]|uniref:RNA polymerase sigma factor n=1 Tax=Parapedobacter deserti TaxID=1912957 RepID=A0ABV7JJY2_9SPHI